MNAGLLVIALLAYSNSFHAGLILDNQTLLLDDVRIRQVTPANVESIVQHTYWWPNEESGLYRPVTTLSYMLNYAVLGNADRPEGYHWVNLILHALNVLLAFALARRLIGRIAPSFFIAAMWAVHPVLTESVTNIVGRADLLAGTTLLGGLLLYIESAEVRRTQDRLPWLAGLFLLTTVGAFSKESAVAVFPAIILYEWIWFRSKWWRFERPRVLLLACAAMLPGLAAMWWARSRVLAVSAPTLFPFVDNPIVAAGFVEGRLTALKVLGKYLLLLVWPASLSVDYSYAQIPLADGRLGDWVAWLAVLSVVLAAAWSLRRNKLIFFAAGIAFLTILPSANLLIPIGTIMAERFLYLPALAFSIILVMAVFAAAHKLRLNTAAPVLLLCLAMAAFGARTRARNNDWKDSLSLWSAAVRTSPDSFKSHTGLAQAMRGDHRDAGQALAENEKSVAILDPLPDRQNTASIYMRTAAQHIEAGYLLKPTGDVAPSEPAGAHFERARSLLGRAVAILVAQRADRVRASSIPGQPGNPKLLSRTVEVDAYSMLSEAERRRGHQTEMLRWAREATAAAPRSPDTWQRLHDAVLAAGRPEEARAVMMEGLLLTDATPLRQMLVAGYSDDPEERKCAISFEHAAPDLNPSCPIVRALACSVSVDAARIARETEDPAVIGRVTGQLGSKFGCLSAGRPGSLP
jgi:hypothetical protein